VRERRFLAASRGWGFDFLSFFARSRTIRIEALPVSSPINTIPPSTVMATNEVLPFQFDFSPLLAAGETISAQATTLTDVTGGSPIVVTLPDAPTQPSANVVQQIVRGTSLTAQHQYRLAAVGTVVAGVKVWAVFLDISCPF
jgi:hypothetical protein